MKSLSCSIRYCPPSGKRDAGAIIRHGFYTTRWGKRRRYRCRTCGKTFCSTIGTPYHRLQHRRAIFDEVASLSVEGLNKSAIARIKRIALEDHLELLRCYYNFVRPHRALKFGREVRTPAQQAGLTTRRLTFREIFSSAMLYLALRNARFVFFNSAKLVSADNSPLSMAA